MVRPINPPPSMMQQTPLYSTKDPKQRRSSGPRPAAFSFSCLVLDKFAAAAEPLPEDTPTNNARQQHIDRTHSIQTDDEESTLNANTAQGESVLSIASSTDSDASAARRLQLRKTLRHQEVAGGPTATSHMIQPYSHYHNYHQQHPWETTTKAIQEEAMRALQCGRGDDDNNTLRTGGDETLTSMQAVFPDDLSDYELGTIMEDDNDKHASSTTIKKSMTAATNDSSQQSHTDVSPDDLKELVQAASTAVDTLERKLIRCRRISVCLLVLLVVVALLAVALAMGLVGNDDKNAAAISVNNTTGRPLRNDTDGAGIDDGSMTTYAPTAAPLSSLESLQQDYLPDYTREALLDTQSPQAQAWAWLERQTQSRNSSITSVTAPSTQSTSAESLLTRFVLATVYYATNGTGWTANTAWLSYKSECEWYTSSKQACENGTATVTDLSLPNNNLTGMLPRELELLTNLQTLDVSFNRGLVVPQDLTALTSLQELDLEQLGMSSIPVLPSRVRHLNLRTNSLSRIPSQIAGLTRLQTLLLGGNVFQTQGIPTFLVNLSNLTYVSMENSQLTGVIPSELGRLSHLEYLILEDNALVGSIPSQLSQLSSLKLLTLHQNSLSGSVPASVCDLKTNHSVFVSVDCDTVQCDCGCGCGL